MEDYKPQPEARKSGRRLLRDLGAVALAKALGYAINILGTDITSLVAHRKQDQPICDGYYDYPVPLSEREFRRRLSPVDMTHLAVTQRHELTVADLLELDPPDPDSLMTRKDGRDIKHLHASAFTGDGLNDLLETQDLGYREQPHDT